jgi:V/A-type H+/Na+-transporting ATPase subunit C
MATVDQAYIYSLGRVKELETALLVETTLDRVIEAGEPVAVLRSVGFFRTLEDTDDSDDLEVIFRRERAHNRQQLRELVADSPLETIFLLPYDVQNIKLLLKGKLSGNQAVQEQVVEEGVFRKRELIEAIYDELPSDLPAAVQDDLRELTETFQQQPRFALIDYRLNRRLRRWQLEIARQAANTFVAEYIQRLSDIQNITSTFRRKLHRLNRDSLQAELLETGTLAPSFFEGLYDLGWESVSAMFKPTAYSDIVDHALTQAEQSPFLPSLDFWCSRAMTAFLQRTRQITFGIEPLLAYYLHRDHELKMVRTILAGRTFHYSRDQLQIRLQEVYA